MHLLLVLLMTAATIATLVDIIVRDESRIRYLPKVFWVLLVILIPLIGMVLWFVLGREPQPRPARPAWSSRAAEGPLAPPPVRPDVRSTEQQLADLEREIEIERLRAELARRKSRRPEDPEVG